MIRELLLYGLPVIACFDGEEGDGEDGNDGDSDGSDSLGARLKQAEEEAEHARAEADRTAAGVRQAAAEAAQATERAFSQDDVNKFLAEDRRRHQEKLSKLENSYKDLLADKTLATEQREKLEGELQDLQASQRTKGQQEAYERKQEKELFQSEVSGYKESATRWERMYKDSVILRSLQDAAIDAESFNPAQIVGLLRSVTEMRATMDNDGNEVEEQMVPKVDFPDIDEQTGERIVTLCTPQEAVQRMKQLPKIYGNLFRANVVSGIGSGAATGGVTSGEGGRIDVAKLSPEQYRKMRKDNPEALGLRR